MADVVDSMSDAELRNKLAEHGFPIVPVTNSTRKLLVKKLKLILDKNKGSKVDSRKSLAGFSSGEDSDIERPVKDKTRHRATIGGSMLPPVTTSKTFRTTPKRETAKPARDSESDDESKVTPIKTHEEVETVTTRRVTKMYSDDYDTGSDSEVDSEKKTSSPIRSNSRSSDYISSTLPSNETFIPKTSTYKSSITSRQTLGGPSYTSSKSGTESLNAIRSRLGLTSSFGDRPSFPGSPYSSSYKATTEGDEVESPYLSSFTRRLTSLNSDLPRTSLLTSDRNGSSPSYIPKKSYYPNTLRGDIGGYRGRGEKRFLSNNVSMVLIGVLALFFFFLFGAYMLKSNDVAYLLDNSNSIIPVCKSNIPGNHPGEDCILEEEIHSAKDLFKIIHPELSTRTKEHQCGGTGILPYLREKDVYELVSRVNGDLTNDQILSNWNNLQFLVLSNPQWGLSVVDSKKYSGNLNELTPLKTMDSVIRQRFGGYLAMIITNPGTPILCKVFNFLYLIANYILIGIASCAALFGGHYVYKYYKAYDARRTEEIFSMVEQIMDIISQEADDNPSEPYVPIDHVRDTLILPQNRDKMVSIWDAAVKYIQKNESRVRVEVQSVDGEDCKVWRWVAPHGSSPRRSGTWQGQAFETQVGSVNNLTVSPSPCLKIRHMIEKGDNNPDLRRIIQDAILEKCGEQCRILHIDLDPNSGCVYVKCASTADAGVVYRSLHGWWYEGNLITVKYLHLERYMMRFPHSPSGGQYLKPSKPIWNN